MLGIRRRMRFTAFLLLAMGTALAVAQEPTEPAPPAPLTAADYLAPLSRLRFGPFAVYSVQVSGSMSNRPVGTSNADLIRSASVPESKSFMGQGSVSIGMNKRFGGGAISFQYTPNLTYQSSFGYSQVNHAASLTLDREFRSTGWRFSLGMHGATTNQFSTLLQQDEPQFQPVLRLNVPLSNLDLLNIISEPMVLTASQPEMLLTGRRLANASAGLNISKRLSSKGSLRFGFTYGVNRAFEAETLEGLAFSNYRSTSFSSTIGYSHRITSRQTLGVNVSDQRNYFQNGHTQLQSVTLSYNVAMGRRWAVNMTGGPGLNRAIQVFNSSSLTPTTTGFKPTAVGSIFLSRTTRASMFRVGYSRGFYTGGLTGGQQNESVVASYTPTMRGYRWRVSLNGGYNWIYGVGGIQQSSGWTVRPSFQYPLTRTLILGIQYAYFQQRFGAGSSYANLQEFNRYVASVSLQWILTRSREVSP